MRKLLVNFLVSLLAVFSLAAHAGPALQAFEPDSLTQIVEKHQGKPFVLIVWSLDCVYCQASMKALAQERRTRKDLRVVTVSTDAVTDPQLAKLMQQRLASADMRADAWAFGAAPPEQLRYMIDPKWRGEMPRSYWFNARGERVAYSGIITVDTIARLTVAW